MAGDQDRHAIVTSCQLPSESIQHFAMSVYHRKGLDSLSEQLGVALPTEPTEQDVVTYINKVFMEPLAGFKTAPYGHKMSAFHNRMAALWLQEFGDNRWG